MVKFNEDTCKCLIENHGKGIPLKQCADIAGISRATLYNWMNKGEKSKRGKYHDFYLNMRRARAKFIAHHIQKVEDSKDWKASQYLLQCVEPESFVVKEKREIQAEANIKTELISKLERPLPELKDDD